MAGTTTGAEKRTTALVKYAEAPLSFDERIKEGELLAQTNYLGMKNKGEGYLVMAVARQMGMDLVKFQNKYHYRQGRFSITAHGILNEFEVSGGKFKVIERSPTRAAIELTRADGEKYLSEITWEQAEQEPFVYDGNEREQLEELKKPLKQRKFKNKYQTARSRMQMLWARAVSDGVGTVAPGCRQGYTPEETDDIIEAEVVQPRQEKNITPDKLAEIQNRIKDAEVVHEPIEDGAGDHEVPPGDNPIAMAKAMKTSEVDFSVCPVGKESKGVKWSDMDSERLKKIFHDERVKPHLKNEHQAAIIAVLDERGEAPF